MEPTFEASPSPPEEKRKGFAVPRWLMAGIAIVLVGALGYGIGVLTKSDADSTINAAPTKPRSPTTPTTPPTPTVPIVPGAAALSGLVVRQADVPSTFGVQLIPGGNQVSGQTTLDLCNGTFPSESLRAARLQVVMADTQGDIPLSTEAVLYTSPAGTTQAFSELASVATKCPSTPVRSPAGGTTVTTKFDAAPDGRWPQVSSVDRLAYSLTTTDPSTGESTQSIAVYLRRGRVLLGLYFPDPEGPLPTIAGQSTIAGIVTAFSSRIAELPESLVNGS